MSDLKVLLERADRAVADVPLPADGLEGLERRRERKQRNRRIRAGAVAVIVALATGIVFFRSLTSAPIPANPPPVKPPPAAAASGTLAYIVHGDVYVADPDGSNALKIADNRGDDACDGRSDGYSAEGSMWSPDGRYLAYRSCSGGVISDAEGNVVATFPLGGWQIAWSPDSTSVAVWDNFSYGETVSTIGVYGLDGARQAQLTMPPGWTPSGDHDPEWMPDGTSVRVENWELPLDGSTPRPLPSRGGDPYATYSPDGLLVAYSASGSLTVARSDGSEPRQVFDRGAPSSDWGYAWSPTGDRIAFSAVPRCGSSMW